MSQLSVNTITNAAGGNTAQINGQTPSESNMQGSNRIINGDFRINQRVLGTVSASGSNVLDRFINYRSGGAYTVQQSSLAPTGFNNSMLMTNSTAASPTTFSFFGQIIEGFNIADLGFGTANSSSVTVSFWANSSVTGVYSISLTNGNGNRAYPAQYTINSANTWEYKTVTAPVDTTGTWATNNTSGLFLRFNLGSPSARTAPAGAWVAGNFDGANGSTGATTWANTTNATFYITGVQLEAGAVATPFERRPFGAELALCQRYFVQIQFNNYVAARANAAGTGLSQVGLIFPEMRAAPSLTTISGTQDGSACSWAAGDLAKNHVRLTGNTLTAGHTAEGDGLINLSSEL